MVTGELREKIIGKLDTLTQEQAESVLRYIEVMTTYELPPDYDPAKDPAVGFFRAIPIWAAEQRKFCTLNLD